MTYFKNPALRLTIILLLICSNLFAQPNKAVQQPNSPTDLRTILQRFTVDTISIKDKMVFYERLSRLTCTTGTIFFTGNGFPSPIGVQYNGLGTALESYFNQCTTGTKLGFEKCVFKEKDGVISVVSKAIVFK